MAISVRKVKLRSKDVKRIYFESFPKKERMPFGTMVAMSKLWNTRFLSFYENDVLCGFVYFAVFGKIVFIMFLAIDERLRSKGYGSIVLKEISNRYSNKKIIVSIEPCDEAPDIELRKKRKAFYLRNGYRETGYRMELTGVVQEILVANGEFSKTEFRFFMVFYSNATMWPKIWQQKELAIEV